MVMLRPARTRERAGLPCIDPLWNRAVIFGMRPIISDDQEVIYQKDTDQGISPRKGYLLVLEDHI